MVIEMKFHYIYDWSLDLLNFSCVEPFKFKRSIEIDEGIFLDFDENGLPVALELIGASKILHVQSKRLIDSDFKVHIQISKSLTKIEIKVSFSIKLEQLEFAVKKEISNDYLLPALDVVITN